MNLRATRSRPPESLIRSTISPVPSPRAAASRGGSRTQLARVRADGYCAMVGDSESHAERLARKIAALRVFRDAAGKMNLPLSAVDGAVLVVSQFTLAAEGMESGNRPGFSAAASPNSAEHLYGRFCAVLRGLGLPVTLNRTPPTHATTAAPHVGQHSAQVLAEFGFSEAEIRALVEVGVMA